MKKSIKGKLENEMTNKVDKIALFVACCALLLTVWQGLEIRHHNRISVRPHLDATLVLGNSPDVRKGLRIDNAGVGPAKITRVEYFINGEPVKQSNPKLYVEWDVLRKLGFDLLGNATDFNMKSSPSGIVLAQGNEYYPIEILRVLEVNEVSLFDPVSVKIQYESSYGEKCSLLYFADNPDAYEIKGPC